MKKVLKYLLKTFRKIDVSPLDSSHLSFKFAIFLVWGVNVLFFVSKDLIYSEILSDPIYKYKTTTQVVKISPLGLSKEIEFKFYIPETSGLISSYDFNLPIYEFNRIDRERSPPII